MPESIDITAQLQADIAKRDWRKVHLDGDRREPVKLWPRLGRYAGEGIRRERGGQRDG